VVATAALALLLQALSGVAAAVEMNSIDFNSLPGGRFEIRMGFDSRPPEPQGFTIERPARIALDLQGVSSSLEQKSHSLGFDNAQEVKVLTAGGRTRVIIELVDLVPYDTSIEGNELVVAVGSGGSRDFIKETPTALTRYAAPSGAPAPAGATAITDFEFERGDEGEGRIVLSLSDSNADMDVSLEGNTIRLNFFDTTVPENLMRRYDVTDFATPVSFVDVKTVGQRVDIDIRASGEYDYLAYQADNTYVVSVKPLTPEEIELKEQEFQFVGESLSLNFQDIEVRAVLQLIADFTDLNLVASDTVTGRITLRLQNVPWDQALDLILKTKGLDKRQVGNVLMVAPAAEIAEREKQELETNKQLEELAPLQTEFIRVLYADARELFELFNNQGGTRGAGTGAAGVATGQAQFGGNQGGFRQPSILSPRGQVIVDERTNSLLVTETADKLDEFRRLIALIDVPVRQVLIEARIVVANTDFAREIGIQWGAAARRLVNGDALDLGGSLATIESLEGSGVTSAGFPEGLMVDQPVANATSSFALGFTTDDFLLRAELSALESSGRGEIVSQTKVITGDKQQATIQQGTQIPYQEATSSGATNIAFEDAVLKLDVTPYITPDDRIIMELAINQDSVGELTVTGVPTIDTTELRTEVLVSNGETIVLGGVFQTQEVFAESKTPFLGDLPFVGRLFRRDTVDESKVETLIFITPKILTDKILD
jgi:type IV pilus assembly protein PilQ